MTSLAYSICIHAFPFNDWDLFVPASCTYVKKATISANLVCFASPLPQCIL